MESIRWGIVGVGIAGRARARAIREDPSALLVAAFRGRFAEDLQIPLVDELPDLFEQVDAVAVCSPNEVHAEQVRAALRARKHVVVEFPLATSVDRARKLFNIARAANRVLHVEHIELLSGTARTLGSHVTAKKLRSLHVEFTRSGSPIPGVDQALGNVARLHRAVDLGGEIARFDSIESEPGELRATGRFALGASLTLRFRQGPELKRHTTLEANHRGVVWHQDGQRVFKGKHPQTILQAKGLFARDHSVAMRRIREGVPSYVSEERILHVLQAMEQLAAGKPGPVAI